MIDAKNKLIFENAVGQAVGWCMCAPCFKFVLSMGVARSGLWVASPQASFGVRLSRIHFSPTGRNECVTNEPQRTPAGRLGYGLLTKSNTLRARLEYE